MRFDLDAEALLHQAQAPCALRRLDDATRKRWPIDVCTGGHMGVVVAHRAVHLGQQRHAVYALASVLQTHQHIGDFFAHGGGAGGLSMGATQHGFIRIAVRHLAQFVDQGIHRR